MLQNYAKAKKSEVVVARFPHICMDAANLFKMKFSNNGEAAEKLLAIINAIIRPKESTAETAKIGNIEVYENDTIEYIGGYVLKKALKKFAQNSEVTLSVCAAKPTGSLVPRMEKVVGALKYPIEECMLLLQHVYLQATKEGHKILLQSTFLICNRTCLKERILIILLLLSVK